MNVLIIVPWDQEFGGVTSVVGNLARYLKKFDNSVYFFYPGTNNLLHKGINKIGFVDCKLRLRVPLVKNHNFRSIFSFMVCFPLTIVQIVYVLYINKINIVNIHYPLENFFYFAICSKLLRIKLITSIHGADIFPGGKSLERYPKFLMLLFSLSDCIVAPSNAYLEEFLNRFSRYRKKGMVIHNGVDLAELQINHRKFKLEEKYILCVAAHNEKKGIDTLLVSFAKISTFYDDINLVLVGDGPLRHQYEKMAESLRISKRVKFLGEMGRLDVINLIYACELLVLSSRSEPFGIVITEAMACRIPVVATSVGGIPEIIVNGKNGILVEPDDSDSLCNAICSILDNDIFREQLGNNGYQNICSKFTAEHTGNNYVTLYRRILE